MSLRRLGSIVVKELRQLRRDRLTFAMIIGIPTMQLILFGYAINLDVRNLETAVLDQANTARSRELVAGMAATGVIHVGRHVSSTQEIEALLARRRDQRRASCCRPTSRRAWSGATGRPCRSSSTAPSRSSKPRRASSRPTPCTTTAAGRRTPAASRS